MRGKLLAWIIIVFLLLIFSGCGFSNVVKRGEYIDQKSIQAGTPRKECLARFGSPVDTKVDQDGLKTDIFRCPQGEPASGKALKGTGILLADVLTYGLTEFIFTPATESKEFLTFEIFYDNDERVREVKFITDQNLIETYEIKQKEDIEKKRISEDAPAPVKPPLLAQSVELGERIGVVIKKNQSEKDLKIPGKGVGSSMGRGAEVGAAIGLSTIRIVGPLFILVTPITTSLGAVYGGVASEDSSKWDEAEAIFRASFAEIDLDRLFEERIITFAKENGYTLDPPEVQISDNVIPTHSDYESLSREGVSLVLELSEFTIELRPVGDSVGQPSRRLVTSVRSRVIRTADGVVLEDRVISDELDFHSLDEWTLGNGLQFRKEVSLAPQRIAESIITELFFLHPLPERTVGSVDLGLKMLSTLSGPEPIYPPPKDRSSRVDSLQPTLRWEPFQGSEVTYDLKIWRGNPKKLIYSRERLMDPYHTLETPLQQESWHKWTVRARYKMAGQTRTTGWAMWTMRPSRSANWITLGATKIMPDGRPQYYGFRTP